MTDATHDFSMDQLASELMGELQPDDELLTLPEVKARIKKSTATVYRWMERGILPRAIQYGPNSVMWRKSEIDRFISFGPTKPV